jgi:hypothetical protein
MPITFIALGFILVFAGIFMAVGGIANVKAGGSAVKSISIEGPSWLILVAIGAGVIVFGGYTYREDKSEAPAPTTTLADEPYDYGDDIVLDALYEDCDLGSMVACDRLYQQSPGSSAYEYFGITCGRRTDPIEGTCEGLEE